MPLSQAYRDAAYPEETGAVFATLITLEHEDLEKPLLLTDCGEDIIYDTDLIDANGNVAALAGIYRDFPIKATAPGQSEDQPRGTLLVPNIDQAIGAMIDAITTPFQVTLTVVLASDHQDIVSGPHRGLELTNVRGDALAVEGEVSRRSRAVKRWPKYWISQRVYKAAFRR